MSRLVTVTLLVAATLTLPEPAGAQRTWAGARLGLTSSNLSANDSDLLDTSARRTLTASVVFGTNVTRYLAIQPELAYVQKGGSGGSTPDDEFTIDVRYIELQFPLVLTLPLPDSRFRPRLYSGLAAGVELSCDVRGPGPDGKTSRRCGWQDPFHIMLAFTETSLIELGWLLGAGVDFAVGPGAVTADLRYNLGLTDINDLGDLLFRVENRALQAVAGYVLYLGGPYEPPHRFPDRPTRRR